MQPRTTQQRFALIDSQENSHPDKFARDVEAGLTSSPKSLPCRYFYDETGSQLFEQICRLPEYYLTRAETQILRVRAGEIASQFSEAIALGELGSGSAAKTRILMEAFLRRHGELRYVPVDVSRTMLEESSQELLQDYPSLEIIAIAGEYHHGLPHLKEQEDRRKLILWLGGTLGNMERPEAVNFLSVMRDAMRQEDRLLIGVDLRKDRKVLEKAYNDSRGLTSRFNLNLLTRINRELRGNFDPDAFRHNAVYDEEAGRIEMFLVSRQTQQVSIEKLGMEVFFEAEEAIHTENSYKYSPLEIQALAAGAGLRVEQQWLDDGNRFSSNLLAPIS